MKNLTERERSIAKAAYLKGLAVGLSVDRTKTWHRQVRKSELVTTPLLAGLDDFLSDGRGFNPLFIYERNNLSDDLCAEYAHADACQAVHDALHGAG